MAPAKNTTFYEEVTKQARITPGASLVEGDGRSAMEQGGYQFAGVVCTLAVSIIGGVFTGFLLKQLDVPTAGQAFDDNDYWIVPSEDPSSCEEDGEAGQKLLGASDIDNDKL